MECLFRKREHEVFELKDALAAALVHARRAAYLAGFERDVELFQLVRNDVL